MKRNISWGLIGDHLILIIGVIVMFYPIILFLFSSSLSDASIAQKGLQFKIGDQFSENVNNALFNASGFSGKNTGLVMLKNSLYLGVGFAVGKIIISMMAAYAIVYFRFRFATLAFWLIFTTLLLPLEVRILPTYEITQQLGLLNTYTGMILPLIASATATFFFRQFFRSVPDELLEAARIDGAGPIRFFIDILVPLSRTMIAAMFIIMFVYGWNQYLWPVMVTTDEGLFTLVRGIKEIYASIEGNTLPELGKTMVMALLAITPPVLLVIFFQSWFIKGLTESDK